MIINDNPTMTPGEYLEHHGIKGMKWGVRNARKEVRNQAKTSRKIIKSVRNAKTEEERAAAIEQYKTDVIKRIRSKDFREAYHAANTVTKGDMVTQILLAGPMAGITIPAIRAQSKQRQKTGIDQELVIARDILKEMQTL